MSEVNILELFPVPVYTTRIPEELANIIPWFNNQEMLTDKVDQANYGQRSKNSYILNEEPTKPLADFILKKVKDYADDTLCYDYDSYKFSQSWLSYKMPGQHHTNHTHPNSLISGVFYYGEPVENTPAIRFNKMHGGMHVSYIQPKGQKDKRKSKFAWEHFEVNFIPGLLLLFPSWLNHSVPINNTDRVRCSLAFNVVPTVGFGEEESLTELKF